MAIPRYILTKNGTTITTFFTQQRDQLIIDGWTLAQTSSITETQALQQVQTYEKTEMNVNGYLMSTATLNNLSQFPSALTNFSTKDIYTGLNTTNCNVEVNGMFATIQLNFTVNGTPANDVLCKLPTTFDVSRAIIFKAYEYSGSLGNPTAATLTGEEVPILIEATTGNVVFVSTTPVTTKNYYACFNIPFK